MSIPTDIIKKHRIWWDQSDEEWKNIFRKALGIENKPTDDELDKIVNLSALDCSLNLNQISDLQPLHALKNLQYLDC